MFSSTCRMGWGDHAALTAGCVSSSTSHNNRSSSVTSMSSPISMASVGRRVGCLAGLAHRLYLIDAHDVGRVVPNVGLDVAVDADDLAAIFGLGERVVAVLRLLVEAAKLEHVVFVDRIGADIVDRAGVLGQTDEAEVTDVQGAAPITRDEVGELLVSVQRQADRGRVDDGVANRVDWAHLQSGVVLDSSSCADSPLRLRLLWRFCS